MDMAKVKPLDLDAHLGKVKNRVALVSVELEGGWKKLPPGVVQLEDDGSVFGRRRPAGVDYIGELPIGPALPAGIAELMKINRPDKINDTCGMHVHMSFDNLWHYKVLMEPEYQASILHYLSKWGKEADIPEAHTFWSRIRGESRFCRNEFWPDLQAGTKNKDHNQERRGHRYTVVHYCGRLNTIECRVLPMFGRVSTGISAVHEVIKITNASLYVLGKKHDRKKITGKVILDDGAIYEESVTEQL